MKKIASTIILCVSIKFGLNLYTMYTIAMLILDIIIYSSNINISSIQLSSA